LQVTKVYLTLVGVSWADAVPNLLIGLREGLEAGLVVSILLAAVRRVDESAERRAPSAAVWLGVLGAVMLSGCFAAVLSYSTDTLSSRAQDAVGGVLSVLAVALVTGMVFWMRRTARVLSAHLRREVEHAMVIGAGALTLTAFLAVGREGLETTLFIWTAIKASGTTFAPLVGVALGLGGAVVLCWLLYRRAVRIDLAKFFNRTAIVLIVIAAGVLAYGLGDLQEAGWLPGLRWVAFDLTQHVDPNAWWVAITTGVTELAPRMTVLQVVVWITFLAVVIPAFVSAGRSDTAAVPMEIHRARRASRWERIAARRAWPVAMTLVVAPALVAGAAIVALPSASAATTTTVTVTRQGCANDWRSGRSGTQTFEVRNNSGHAGEVNLTDASGAVVAEIETIGPATVASMSATIGPGTYTFVCHMEGGTTRSAPVVISGTTRLAVTVGVKPVTLEELAVPNRQYQRYAATMLRTLARDVDALRADLLKRDGNEARGDWLVVQMDWERVGASYDSFGAAGQAVDGLPGGLPDGVRDKGFIGLHRVEYGLYHDQSAAELVPFVDQLSTDIATVERSLTTDDEAGDPTNLPLRVHEILEDAQRDHLSGLDDQGAGAAYAETYADTQVTRVVLDELTPLITARASTLVPTVTRQLDALQSALLATRVDGRWTRADAEPRRARERVDAALGAVLESLSTAPNLLEVPPTP